MKKKSKPASPAPKKKAPSPGAAPSPEDSDLARFCESVHLEEISFESWEVSHSDLDLRVPLFLASPDAEQGGSWPVKYSRKIDSTRHPASQVVSFPPGSKDGQEVRVKGLGDEAHGKSGDLIVFVRIKP